MPPLQGLQKLSVYRDFMAMGIHISLGKFHCFAKHYADNHYRNIFSPSDFQSLANGISIMDEGMGREGQETMLS